MDAIMEYGSGDGAENRFGCVQEVMGRFLVCGTEIILVK